MPSSWSVDAAANASSTVSPGMNRRTARRANGRRGSVSRRCWSRAIQRSRERIGRMTGWCRRGIPSRPHPSPAWAAGPVGVPPLPLDVGGRTSPRSGRHGRQASDGLGPTAGHRQVAPVPVQPPASGRTPGQHGCVWAEVGSEHLDDDQRHIARVHVVEVTGPHVRGRPAARRRRSSARSTCTPPISPRPRQTSRLNTPFSRAR